MTTKVQTSFRPPTTTVASQDRLATEFKKVFDLTEPFVRSVLYRIVGAENVDDLTQETFIKVWKNLSSFNESANIKTWIYRITVNCAYDYLRKKKLKSFLLLDSVQQNDEIKPTDQLELQQLLQLGLDKLSAKQRVIMVLFYYEDLSIEEISLILKLPEGTVKSRLHHARAKYTDFLKSQGVNYETR